MLKRHGDLFLLVRLYIEALGGWAQHINGMPCQDSLLWLFTHIIESLLEGPATLASIALPYLVISVLNDPFPSSVWRLHISHFCRLSSLNLCHHVDLSDFTGRATRQ